MIGTVELNNPKSDRSIHIHFDDSRLHGLVGQNGCGKTSVLQALQRFGQNPAPNSSFHSSLKDGKIPRVESDSSDLAASLEYLRDEYPERLQVLQEMLKRIVPGIQQIEVRTVEAIVDFQRSIQTDEESIESEAGREIIFEMKTGRHISAHAIGAGTMLILGLMMILMHPQRPNLILLDNIEQGLHPKSQRELIAVLQDIIQTNSDLQIIFTTHSPYILDPLNPSQIHVLSNAGDGYTKIKRLDEHPDTIWAKQTLTTGEFWDAVGEDWVADSTNNC
jgi:predicted ATPase